MDAVIKSYTSKHLLDTYELVSAGSSTMVKTRPQLKCVDGFTMSVQASQFHYCSPRRDIGPYFQVEIGYPSSTEDLLLEYAETPEDPTGTVYGYVPIEVVDAVIKKHGGIAPSE